MASDGLTADQALELMASDPAVAVVAEGSERRQFEARGYKTVGGVRYLERSPADPHQRR